MADEDDLDAMMGGGSSSAPAAAAASASNASAPASAAAPSTASAPAAAASAMDEEEDEDDDDGVNLVLDAPTSTPVRGGPGGAFGTPLSLQSSSRFSKWGAAPGSAASQQQHATPVAAATPTGAPAAAAAQYPVSSGASAAMPAASRSTLTIGGSAGSGALGGSDRIRTAGSAATSSGADADRDANRPFRLPLPSDHLFEAGSHLDAKALIDRPWLAPGADPTDWFNYGFEEETWKLYCQKQIQSRINAKLKTKVTVFDGDEPAARSAVSGGGSNAGAMRPPMPPPPMGMMGAPPGMMPGMFPPGMMPGMPPFMPGMPPHMGMMQPPLPMQQGGGMRPPPQQQQGSSSGSRGGQSIASYDGDDASVPLTRATGPPRNAPSRNPHQPSSGAPLLKRE